MGPRAGAVSPGDFRAHPLRYARQVIETSTTRAACE
jgi:hypothetical protein